MENENSSLLGRLKTKLGAHVAALKHGQPSRSLRVVFVVGQDGAIGTIAFLASMLRASGEKVGVATQQYVEIADERVGGSDKADTNGDPDRLQSLLSHMSKAKCTYALIEIPPELPQHQYVGIQPTLILVRRCGDDYTDQMTLKARLMMLNSLFARTPEFVVFNRDDPCSGELVKLSEVEGVMSFGAHQKSECRITSVKLHPKGSAINLLADHQTEMHLVTTLPGKQSIYNAVAAASAAYVLHVPIEAIEEGAADLKQVPGLLEYIPLQRPYQMVVDSATTPGGLAESLESLKHFTRNRLIVLLGAPLDLPPSQRPVFGEIAAQFADRLVITDGEYPPDQSPHQVREQLMQGVLAIGGEARAEEISDRKVGIEKAFGIARRGDTVALAASTQRPYRQVGAERLQWSDRKIAGELLAA